MAAVVDVGNISGTELVAPAAASCFFSPDQGRPLRLLLKTMSSTSVGTT